MKSASTETKQSKGRIYAHCDRRGVIEFSTAPKIDGLLCLGSGHGKRFREIVTVVARMAYDNETLLVAGVPEAENDGEALEAVQHFRLEILKRQVKRSDEPCARSAPRQRRMSRITRH